MNLEKNWHGLWRHVFDQNGFASRIKKQERLRPNSSDRNKIFLDHHPTEDGAPILAENVYMALHVAYSQPYRAYHNLRHIEDCLHQLEECAIVPNNSNAVQLALWLHDVVYEIGAPDNEEQSATWASTALTQGNVSNKFIETIAELILATKHPSNPSTADAKLVVDIDLSILGRPPAEFARYETRTRAEYQQVPEPHYRSGRAKILQSFLDRPSIYFTEAFRTQYEEQARANLTQSIAKLRV